jgi:Trypsin-co-occurring domain 2
MSDGIELADMIFRLRSELSRAMWAGQNADLRFKAESVELELTVGLEKSTDPKIAVRFWVLDMSAGKQVTSTVTQKITLKLRPVPAADPESDALIDGAALPGEK